VSGLVSSREIQVPDDQYDDSSNGDYMGDDIWSPAEDPGPVGFDRAKSSNVSPTPESGDESVLTIRVQWLQVR
jgi:hypothetical protein